MSYFYTREEADDLLETLHNFNSNFPEHKGQRCFYLADVEYTLEDVQQGLLISKNKESTRCVPHSLKKEYKGLYELFSRFGQLGNKRRVSKTEFTLKIGPTVFGKLLQAANLSPTPDPVAIYWNTLYNSPGFDYIDLDSTILVGMFDYFVSEGILSEAEKITSLI